jgi:hypothetical protein
LPLQQSFPHFSSPFLQEHLAGLPFSLARHVCRGPQQAVVVSLKQQVVPFAQQIGAPFLAGWQLCPPNFSHGWHVPFTQTWCVAQHVSPQGFGPRAPPNRYWYGQFGRHLPSFGIVSGTTQHW